MRKREVEDLTKGFSEWIQKYAEMHGRSVVAYESPTGRDPSDTITMGRFITLHGHKYKKELTTLRVVPAESEEKGEYTVYFLPKTLVEKHNASIAPIKLRTLPYRVTFDADHQEFKLLFRSLTPAGEYRIMFKSAEPDENGFYHLPPVGVAHQDKHGFVIETVKHYEGDVNIFLAGTFILSAWGGDCDEEVEES